MAKYRVVRRYDDLYEGLVQRKIFGIWWTVSKWWYLSNAERELDRIYLRKTKSPHVIREIEI